MILILILIPILFIFISLYIGCLNTFIIENNLNTIILLISVCAIIILSFIILKNIINIDKNNSKLYNINKKSDLYHNYFSLIISLIFAIYLIIYAIIYTKYIYLIISIFIIILFIYFTYISFFIYKKEEFQLIDIIEIQENRVYKLVFSNKEFGLINYYTNNNKYKLNCTYICSYNKKIKIINKIINIKEDVINE